MRHYFEESVNYDNISVSVMTDGKAYLVEVRSNGQTDLVDMYTGECYTVVCSLLNEDTDLHTYVVTDDLLRDKKVLLVAIDHGRGLFTMSDGKMYVVAELEDYDGQMLCDYCSNDVFKIVSHELDEHDNLLSVTIPTK